MSAASNGGADRGAPVAPRVRRFSVNLHCKPNDLWGTVEVISTGRQAAAELARRQFFRGGGWAVVEVREITKDYERFEGGVA